MKYTYKVHILRDLHRNGLEKVLNHLAAQGGKVVMIDIEHRADGDTVIVMEHELPLQMV